MQKPILNKYLFWDVNFDEIDYDVNSKYVIARVLMRGELEDWREIVKYYGKKRLKKEVVEIKYLDKLSLNFCHKIFNIPLEKFKCYNTDPSIQKLWNY